MKKVKDILRTAALRLEADGIENPRLDAEILLAHVLKWRRLNLYIDAEKVLPLESILRFNELINRRLEKILRGDIFCEVMPLHGSDLKRFYTDEQTPNGKPKLSLRNLPPNSLALTTYETLRDYQFSFAEIPWSLIIADEAQKIKSEMEALQFE